MNKLPPSATESESSLIGAMLINPQAISLVSDLVTKEDFFRASNGDLFDHILGMWGEDENSVDIVTVSSKFPEYADYIHSAAELCPSAANAKHYADIVKKASVARSLIKAGNEIVGLGYDTEDDRETNEIVDEAESKLSVLRVDNRTHTHTVAQLGARVVQSIRRGDKPKMISTGFASIDKYAKGLYGSNFVIVGARPGVGKTCLGLAVAQRVAATGGAVAFFSMEMRGDELYERLLSSVSCVSLTRIRERSCHGTELEAIDKAQAQLDSCDLRLIDDSTLSLLSLCGQVRTMSRKSDLKLVVVDYLQLMNMGKKTENRREEVSEMSRKLKSLAMEVNVPIIALSQLNRLSTFDGTKVDISQLKESGSLEQDADQVWLLSWPKQKDPMSDKTVTIEIAKNRNGPMGEATLVWLPQYQRFEE